MGSEVAKVCINFNITNEQTCHTPVSAHILQHITKQSKKIAQYWWHVFCWKSNKYVYDTLQKRYINLRKHIWEHMSRLLCNGRKWCTCIYTQNTIGYVSLAELGKSKNIFRIIKFFSKQGFFLSMLLHYLLGI